MQVLYQNIKRKTCIKTHTRKTHERRKKKKWKKENIKAHGNPQKERMDENKKKTQTRKSNNYKREPESNQSSILYIVALKKQDTSLVITKSRPLSNSQLRQHHDERTLNESPHKTLWTRLNETRGDTDCTLTRTCGQTRAWSAQSCAAAHPSTHAHRPCAATLGIHDR